MFSDKFLFSDSQSVTTTADSDNIYDTSGAGSGTAVGFEFGKTAGTATVFGMDLGAGQGEARPYVYVVFESAGASSNTITVTLSAMIDGGSNTPSTATVLHTTAAFVESAINDGDRIVFPVPEMVPGEAKPRFYKLTYTCSSTVGAVITAGLAINVPTSTNIYPPNYIAV